MREPFGSPEQETNPELRRQLEFACDLITGEVETLQITEHELPFYLKAAEATHCTVKKIAGAGEDFPTYERSDPNYTKDGEHIPPHLAVLTVRKEWVAISISPPVFYSPKSFTKKKGNADAFLKALHNLELNRPIESPESIVKS